MLIYDETSSPKIICYFSFQFPLLNLMSFFIYLHAKPFYLSYNILDMVNKKDPLY